MANIWLTSDWHFNHDKDFVWKARGFESVQEMNKTIIERHNSRVEDEDDVYVLGDLIMGDLEEGEKCLQQLKGKLHIVLGNHDTNNRIKMYEKYAEEICYAMPFKYKKRTFFLSHYQTLTANMDDRPGHCTFNIHGHTHQTTNSTAGFRGMYHVGMDSHDCYPVHIDDVIAGLKAQYEESTE